MEAEYFICSTCKHFDRNTCPAFPKGRILQQIVDENKHDKPIEGQINDLVYEYDENYLAKYPSINSSTS